MEKEEIINKLNELGLKYFSGDLTNNCYSFEYDETKESGVEMPYENNGPVIIPKRSLGGMIRTHIPKHKQEYMDRTGLIAITTFAMGSNSCERIINSVEETGNPREFIETLSRLINQQKIKLLNKIGFGLSRQCEIKLGRPIGPMFFQDEELDYSISSCLYAKRKEINNEDENN